MDRTLAPALQERLEARGLRCVHAFEEEFATTDSRGLLEAAIEDECVLVSRNYGDFTDLAAAYGHVGREFPGILFVPIDMTDPEEQAEAISGWLEQWGPDAARNACRWLAPAQDAAQAT